MKNTLIAGGVAAAILSFATAAAAGTLDPGLYTITFHGGATTEQDPVSISGTGASRSIEIATATSTEVIHATLSGSTLTGSATPGGIALTLNGTATGSNASGSFHLSRAGRAATGTFTIAARSANIAHMPMASGSAQTKSSWDKICDWFASWLSVGGSASAPSTPAPTGSGSTSHGLAPYTPH